jgi:hypothetical protein
MTIFQAFFDESGKFKDHRVVSFCGLCSPPRRIQQFEDEWKGLLRSAEISSLTMKRALRHKRKVSPQIGEQSAQERTEALTSFALCIRKHFEIGVAITIDVAAYHKMSVAAKRTIGGNDDPHYMAFMSAIMAPPKRMLQDDRISLICDDDEGTALNCYRLYRRARKVLPDLKYKLVSLAFADDEVFVPLQAADFLSSLARLNALKKFCHEYYEYVSLFHTLTHPSSPGGIKWVIGSFDEEKLKLTAQGLESLP